MVPKNVSKLFAVYSAERQQYAADFCLYVDVREHPFSLPAFRNVDYVNRKGLKHNLAVTTDEDTTYLNIFMHSNKKYCGY